MPAQRISLAKHEVEAVTHARDFFDTYGEAGKKVVKGLQSILDKLTKVTAKVPGLGLGDVESALIRGAGAKYASWVAGNPAGLLRQLHTVGATTEQLELVGRWLCRQDWIKGQMALPSVVHNWPGWLAKATAMSLEPAKTEAKPAGFQ